MPFGSVTSQETQELNRSVSIVFHSMRTDFDIDFQASDFHLSFMRFSYMCLSQDWTWMQAATGTMIILRTLTVVNTFVVLLIDWFSWIITSLKMVALYSACIILNNYLTHSESELSLNFRTLMYLQMNCIANELWLQSSFANVHCDVCIKEETSFAIIHKVCIIAKNVYVHRNMFWFYLDFF